jgi:hypothetical protein
MIIVQGELTKFNEIFLGLLSSMTTLAKSSTLLIDSTIVPRYLLGLCYKILDSPSLF